MALYEECTFTSHSHFSYQEATTIRSRWQAPLVLAKAVYRHIHVCHTWTRHHSVSCHLEDLASAALLGRLFCAVATQTAIEMVAAGVELQVETMFIHLVGTPGLHSHSSVSSRIPLDPVSVRRSDYPHLELAESHLHQCIDWYASSPMLAFALDASFLVALLGLLPDTVLVSS